MNGIMKREFIEKIVEDFKSGKKSFGKLTSDFKKYLYIQNGAQIGPNVEIGEGTILIGDNIVIEDNVTLGRNSVYIFDNLLIGKNTVINDNVDIRSANIRIGGLCKIGNNLKVLLADKFEIDKNGIVGNHNEITGREFIAGEFLYMGSEVYIGGGGCMGPNSRVKVGKYSMICPNVMINNSEEVVIGDHVGIGAEVNIWTHGSWGKVLEGYPASFSPIKIGSDVWIPARSVILPGVKIGSNVVIGINSVINKDVPSGSLAAGIPIKIIHKNIYPRKLDLEKKADIFRDIMRKYLPLINTKGYDFIDKSIDDILIFESKEVVILFQDVFDVYQARIEREYNNKKIISVFIDKQIEELLDIRKNITFFDLSVPRIIGENSDLVQDLRDYLRRNGIKIFEDRGFASITPIDFQRFLLDR